MCFGALPSTRHPPRGSIMAVLGRNHGTAAIALRRGDAGQVRKQKCLSRLATRRDHPEAARACGNAPRGFQETRSSLLDDPRPAPDPARARYRRGDPRRWAGTGGDAGTDTGAISRQVGSTAKPSCTDRLKQPFIYGAAIDRSEPKVQALTALFLTCAGCVRSCRSVQSLTIRKRAHGEA